MVVWDADSIPQRVVEFIVGTGVVVLVAVHHAGHAVPLRLRRGGKWIKVEECGVSVRRR